MIRNQYRPAAQPQGRTPRQSCSQKNCMATIRKGITHRLADRMRLLDASGITVSRETLAGFENCSVALIARFENDAKAIARRASVRSVVR